MRSARCSPAEPPAPATMAAYGGNRQLVAHAGQHFHARCTKKGGTDAQSGTPSHMSLLLAPQRRAFAPWLFRFWQSLQLLAPGNNTLGERTGFFVVTAGTRGNVKLPGFRRVQIAKHGTTSWYCHFTPVEKQCLFSKHAVFCHRPPLSLASGARRSDKLPRTRISDCPQLMINGELASGESSFPVTNPSTLGRTHIPSTGMGEGGEERGLVGGNSNGRVPGTCVDSLPCSPLWARGQGEQDTGEGVARAWRGRGAGQR
eukprot:gene24341-biopygen2904